MKKISLLLVVIITTISLFFNSCKKGAEDPLISLRSRKARMAGDWKVVKLISSSTSKNSSTTYITNSTLENGVNSSTSSNTTNGITTTTQESYNETITMSFKKDGTFTTTDNVVYTDGSGFTQNVVGSGVWDFMNGVGDAKKKEYISITYLSYNSTSNQNGNFSYNSTKENTAYLYQIVGLKNKSLHLVSESNYNSSSGNTDTDKTEMFLEQ